MAEKKPKLRNYKIARKYFDGERLHIPGATVTVPADMKVPKDWEEVSKPAPARESSRPAGAEAMSEVQGKRVSFLPGEKKGK